MTEGLWEVAPNGKMAKVHAYLRDGCVDGLLGLSSRGR